MQADKT
jgi:hypothetical protein